MTRVAIVGGGITGLTAAFRLRDRGVEAHVYEAGARTGGAIQSTRRDGFLAEHGPNSILETSSVVTELVRDAGLEARKRYADAAAKKRYVVRRRTPAALPMSPPAFLLSPLFSTSAKLRLLREPFVAAASPDAEETLAEFVLRRLGREFLDYAINPFVAGVYAGDPVRLSVRYAFPKLHALEQKYGSLIKGTIQGARERKVRGEVSKAAAPMFSFDDGLEALPAALVRSLGSAVRLQQRVERLAQVGYGWVVNGSVEYDAVVLAGAAPALAKMRVSTERGWTPEPLASLYHPPVSTLALGFRREQIRHPLDGFGMLVPAAERMNILGALFSSSLFPGRAPDGHVLFTVFAGGTRSPETARLVLDDLQRIALADLRALLGVTGEPAFVHHTFWPQAIPQYETSYGKLKSWMDEAEQKHAGLFFAGNYRDGISVADCIVSGQKAAERVHAFAASLAGAPR